MTEKDAIEYEIGGSNGLLCLFSFPPFTRLIAWYYVRKAKRKFKRYQGVKELISDGI